MSIKRMPRSHPLMPRDDVAIFHGELQLGHDVPVLRQNVIDPDPANTRAIRAYEKAGFERDRIETPDGPALLMVRNA